MRTTLSSLGQRFGGNIVRRISSLIRSRLGSGSLCRCRGDGYPYILFEGMEPRIMLSSMPVLVGDFTGDRQYDASDIDAMHAVWHPGQAAVTDITGVQAYDLTGDGVIDQLDATFLIEGVFGTHYGDHNLDGFVNAPDLTGLMTRYGNVYDGPNWSGSDCNGDGAVNAPDLTQLMTNYGMLVMDTGLSANGGNVYASGQLLSFSSSPTGTGPYGYAWRVIGPDGSVVSSGSDADFSFTPSDSGYYRVDLTVTEADGDSRYEFIELDIENTAPTVTISGDSYIILSNTTALSRSPGALQS